MVGVMVTEPDYGSDSALVTVSATKVDGGWTIRGVKTWATFAGRANALMLSLAPTRIAHCATAASRCSSSTSPKRRSRVLFQQDGGGTMQGRAIDTIGYRGMHSYEVAFDGWFAPDENLVGGAGGIGKGFYLPWAGSRTGGCRPPAAHSA